MTDWEYLIPLISPTHTVYTNATVIDKTFFQNFWCHRIIIYEVI